MNEFDAEFFVPISGDLVIVKPGSTHYLFRTNVDYNKINIRNVKFDGDVDEHFTSTVSTIGLVVSEQTIVVIPPPELKVSPLGPLVYCKVLVGERTWFIYQGHLTLVSYDQSMMNS